MNIKLDSILGVLREDDKPTAELGVLDSRVTAVEAGEGIVNTMILVEDTMPVAAVGLLNHGVLLTTSGGGYLANHVYVCREVEAGVYGWVDVTALILADKVDKVTGKGLSTNDFTDIYKAAVDAALPLADGVKAVSSLPSPAAGVENLMFFLTAADGDKRKGSIWKCIEDSGNPGTYIYSQIQLDLADLLDATDVLGDYVLAEDIPDSLIEPVAALPSPVVALEGKVYLLTAVDGTKEKGTIWKCIEDSENTGTYIYEALLTPSSGSESTANKATDFTVINDTKYPSVEAVKEFVQNETLTELIGADVSVAPWTQSKWSASGVCSLTASGWAVSGHQVAYVLITLAAEATFSVSGATVADDDALSAAGTYACYLINENGTVRFKIAGFTEAV